MKFFQNILSRLGQDIAIDLGTANSLVYVKGKGIVIQEPSVVAINQKTGKVLAVGHEAKKMVGRTPTHIVAMRPLVKGVVSDFEVTEQMLKYFITKAYQRKFILSPGPRVIVGAPFGVTEVEKRAVRDATLSAGAREVFLIEEPMAAAIGARLAVQEPGGNFIVDIGGGTTEVAVLSLGGIVYAKSLRIAGDKMTEDIIHFAQEEYKIFIGERTAESIKIAIGSAYPLKERKEVPLRGRNLITGLPEEILVSDEDVRRAMERSVRQIVNEIKATVEETPPELLADIMHRGIFLAGGGALLRGLDTLIMKETKIPTRIVEDPLTAVVRGAGLVLENLDELRDVLTETENLEPPH
ncbi:MAG: rod shape-determining protein [Candidatus Wildermuthbacteria bacterium RIFCSPLOWO2_02_FULL_47_9c]|uniref:Cell shape-determining protein MreB n=3 Tax=Parcubacteria group TaxID=1794811 RepID=A0A0G1ZMQ4_9BACT|nr:MAG: rod shape-determining protein MreB, rod shape-determining protein MreB [Candidatus Yanofskybacteria bacterium GW2011_GWC1_48_11]KKW04608.1 MAG: Rod shape-determining protein MreB [Parcubacteria group bacterium GW2011_GWB1_49_12]KKW13595.1 MAG: Rod shape-determining protein MreB [Parcubacteria group bacterium GW2011_GWA2_50_10]KKW29387.1 MAG: Rod shape-determining protein MreB [Candidatus Kaiserbacteria bacterium GW2011_GWC2_52_8b]OHA61391.1 MAG: rod shape-determining protein [Candidatus